VEGIEATEDVPGRMHVIDEEQPFGVIVDAARTPAALSRLLDDVRDLQYMTRSSTARWVQLCCSRLLRRGQCTVSLV
jgi:UDP-N-acetylmuramyl tripeptide synthase